MTGGTRTRRGERYRGSQSRLRCRYARSYRGRTPVPPRTRWVCYSTYAVVPTDYLCHLYYSIEEGGYREVRRYECVCRQCESRFGVPPMYPPPGTDRADVATPPTANHVSATHARPISLDELSVPAPRSWKLHDHVRQPRRRPSRPTSPITHQAAKRSRTTAIRHQSPLEPKFSHPPRRTRSGSAPVPRASLGGPRP